MRIRYFTANPCGADVPVCRIAGFQTRRRGEPQRHSGTEANSKAEMLNGLFPLSVPSCLRGKRYAADLEIGDTAGLETCATFTNGNGSPHSQMRPLCHAGNEPSFLRSASALRLGFRLLFLLPWLCLLGLGSGCQTATQSLFTASGPGWHVQQGQALWRPQRGLPEFGGDLVLASDDTAAP